MKNGREEREGVKLAWFMARMSFANSRSRASRASFDSGDPMSEKGLKKKGKKVG
jgi:hypothetical protein